MALFRRHRGSLAESLKTSIVIKNLDDLKNAIYEDWKMWEGALKKSGEKFSINSFDVKIEPYYGKRDDRCGWYTQIVSADIEEKDRFCAVGFLSEQL